MPFYCSCSRIRTTLLLLVPFLLSELLFFSLLSTLPSPFSQPPGGVCRECVRRSAHCQQCEHMPDTGQTHWGFWPHPQLPRTPDKRCVYTHVPAMFCGDNHTLYGAYMCMYWHLCSSWKQILSLTTCVCVCACVWLLGMCCVDWYSIQNMRLIQVHVYRATVNRLQVRFHEKNFARELLKAQWLYLQYSTFIKNFFCKRPPIREIRENSLPWKFSAMRYM